MRAGNDPAAAAMTELRASERLTLVLKAEALDDLIQRLGALKLSPSAGGDSAWSAVRRACNKLDGLIATIERCLPTKPVPCMLADVAFPYL